MADDKAFARDSTIKNQILSRCKDLKNKHLALNHLALVFNAIWDPVDMVWIFPDGTRCGIMLHGETGEQLVAFRFNVPLRKHMH